MSAEFSQADSDEERDEDDQDASAAAVELRTWLRDVARLPESRLDELIATLRNNWVDDVETLRDSVDVLETRLPAAAPAIAKPVQRRTRDGIL